MMQHYRYSQTANAIRVLFVFAIVLSIAVASVVPAFAQQPELLSLDAREMDGQPMTLESLPENHYCVESAGVDLYSSDSGTIELTPHGTLVSAHLFWSGRYRLDEDQLPNPESILANGDDSLDIKIMPDLPASGTLPAALSIVADRARYHRVAVDDAHLYWYTYHADVTDLLLPNDPLTPSDAASSFTVSGLKSDSAAHDNGSEGHGVGIIAVYVNDSCPLSTVAIQYGLDGFYHARQAPYGPNSEVVCTEFQAISDAAEAESNERIMGVHMLVGGVESFATGGHRPNYIFYATGTGNLPTDLANTNDKRHVPYVQTEQRPYPLIADEGEYDVFQSQITIPTDSRYACFQIESPSHTDPAGISAVWMGLATQLQPPELPEPALVASKSRDVSWRYTVKNLGTNSLDNVVLNGGKGVDVDCHSVVRIAPVGSMNCTAAADHQFYRNVSFVTANSADADDTTPTTSLIDWLSPNKRSAIRAEVLINNALAHIPPGIYAKSGSELLLQVRITNEGDYPLNLIGLHMTQLDSQAVQSQRLIPWDCLDNRPLEIGESRICTGTLSAQSGPTLFDITVQSEPILPSGDVTIPGVIDTVSAYYVGF